MRRTLITRVDRLEGQEAQGPPQARVIWLGLDGPEDPADGNYKGYAIYLPRKAATVEEWCEWVEKVLPRLEAWRGNGGDTDEPTIDEAVGPLRSLEGPCQAHAVPDPLLWGSRARSRGPFGAGLVAAPALVFHGRASRGLRAAIS